MITVILFGTAGLCAITLGLFLRSLDRPRRPRSAMFGGDVTDTVIIDCESDADVLIAGNAKNVTMESVRHRGLGGITGAEAIAAIEESKRSGILRAMAASGTLIADMEHELGIKGHEVDCPICRPLPAFYNENIGPMHIAGACTCVGIRSGDRHREGCPQQSRVPGPIHTASSQLP